MDIPTAQAQGLPLARGLPGPAEGATVRPMVQPSPQDTSAPDEDRDYPTPPPPRVFFVSVRYRRLGRGEPMPLAPEDLDERA
jgi:hypothetical protein